MDQARERRIEIIRRRLLRSRLPRFQVAFILLLTGLAGFLISFSLLYLGVSVMWLRYPIVLLIAYGIFLFLLAVWLWLQRRGLDADHDPSVLDFIPTESPSPGEPVQFGGGGDFGGGGAGGSWGEGVSSASTVSDGGSAPSGISFDFDLEEGWLLVLAIVALVGGVIASLYVIYIAPALLAEILLDGVLVAGLYKRVKHIEPRHWLRAAIRRTLIPALLATLFVTVTGYAFQRMVPEAHSVGEVWKHLVGR